MKVRHIFAVLAMLALIVWSFAYLALDLRPLVSAEAMLQMGRYAAAFFPPDLSPDYLRSVWGATLETIAISLVSTLVAVVAGILLALPAAGRLGRIARVLSRATLNFLRSIPELVWAALTVMAAGLGPFAGTLALALHTAGVLGRLFAETLENAPRASNEALRLAGSTPAVAFVYGTVPHVLPQLIAYSLYRWEINIRMAAILGVVGAGGLGQMLFMSLSLFQQPQAMTVIGAMLLLVAAVDGASTWLRRHIG